MHDEALRSHRQSRVCLPFGSGSMRVFERPFVERPSCPYVQPQIPCFATSTPESRAIRSLRNRGTGLGFVPSYALGVRIRDAQELEQEPVPLPAVAVGASMLSREMSSDHVSLRNATRTTWPQIRHPRPRPRTRLRIRTSQTT